MDRCSSCNGVVTKEDSVCYLCGDRLPKRPRTAIARPISAFGNMLFIASLGMTAISFFSTKKLPLSVTLAISGGFFLLSVIDRQLTKTSTQRAKIAERVASRVRQ
jgi:hypothetical protein